ncbi:lymphocyte function-associated antigen 3 isoform X2 [Zonotrichia albicollis]|uniref:lymphocyte function-associated antigen 3 isoform X2 n=1 Tax=Zonotrichia albicollis TaxID=44394 RepID=UPI003D80D422
MLPPAPHRAHGRRGLCSPRPRSCQPEPSGPSQRKRLSALRGRAGAGWARPLPASGSAEAVTVRAPMWLLTSLLCLSLLLAHGYQKEIIGIMGENFTFPVQIDQKTVDIVWKKNKHKVAEWEDQNKLTYYSPLRGRSVLMKNGSLTIVNLEKGDTGTYELVYWDSVEEHSFNFELVVLDSLPKPEINCSTSDDELILNCTANFQASLNYTWKLSNNPHRYRNWELSVPLKNVDATTNATCIIKYSQTERSSEISLIQCLPEEKGIIKLGRRTAQNNSPVNGSGEHEQLYPGNSQQQSNSERDRALDGNEVALKDKQIVENGVNQEEVPQDTEGENGGHPDNSSSCTKGDLEA